MSREIAIQYKNDLNLAEIDLSETSLRIGAIRYLSDFRDNVLSKVGVGRRFIRSYNANRGNWNRGISVLMLAIALALWSVRRGKKPSMPLPNSSVTGLRNRT
jgi:hypothetical protein